MAQGSSGSLQGLDGLHRKMSEVDGMARCWVTVSCSPAVRVYVEATTSFQIAFFRMKMLLLVEHGKFALSLTRATLCGRVGTVISAMAKQGAQAWDHNLSGHNVSVERLWEAWWCGSPRTTLSFAGGI